MYANDALKAEIERELKAIKDMEVGSEKLGDAITDVTKLIDKVIEMDRAENEAYSKAEDRKAEQNNRLVSHVITGISVVGGMFITVVCFNKSMEFEKTGTITTFAGKLMSSIPFKWIGKK